MKPHISLDRLLNLQEAADYLGYSESGMRKLVAKGELLFCQRRKHGRIKFKPEWLEDFIRENTHDLRTEPPQKATRKAARKRTDLAENSHGLDWNLVN